MRLTLKIYEQSEFNHLFPYSLITLSLSYGDEVVIILINILRTLYYRLDSSLTLRMTGMKIRHSGPNVHFGVKNLFNFLKIFTPTHLPPHPASPPSPTRGEC